VGGGTLIGAGATGAGGCGGAGTGAAARHEVWVGGSTGGIGLVRGGSGLGDGAGAVERAVCGPLAWEASGAGACCGTARSGGLGGALD
jgi:hypothetical protein